MHVNGKKYRVFSLLFFYLLEKYRVESEHGSCKIFEKEVMRGELSRKYESKAQKSMQGI